MRSIKVSPADVVEADSGADGVEYGQVRDRTPSQLDFAGIAGLKVHVRTLRHRTSASQAFCAPVGRGESFLEQSPALVDSVIKTEAATFKFQRFLLELVYHEMFPLSLPFVWAMEGRVGAENRAFWGGGRVFWSQMLVYAMWVSLDLLYLVVQPPDIFPIEMVVLNLIIFMRNTVIATKYGYMSIGDLQELREVPNLQQKQVKRLMASWANPDIDLLYTELTLAQKVQRIDLSLTDFHIHKEDEVAAREHLHHAVSFFEGRNEKGKITSTTFSADLLVLQLFKDACEQRGGLVWSLVVALLHVSVVPIYKASIGMEPFGSTPAGVVVSIAQVVLGGMFFGNLAQFLLIGSMDMSRRSAVQCWLNDLITKGYVCTSKRSLVHTMDGDNELETSNSLLIDMQVPQNAVNWLRVRQVLSRLGSFYQLRATAYAGLFFAYMLLLLIYMAVQLLMDGRLDTLTLVWVSYDALVVLGLLMALAVPAAKANGQHKVHMSTLAHHSMNTHCRLVELDLEGREGESQVKEQLKHTRVLLDLVMRNVEADDALRPVKIFGFTAGPPLFRSLFGALGSAAVVLFNAVTQL